MLVPIKHKTGIWPTRYIPCIFQEVFYTWCSYSVFDSIWWCILGMYQQKTNWKKLHDNRIWTVCLIHTARHISPWACYKKPKNNRRIRGHELWLQFRESLFFRGTCAPFPTITLASQIRVTRIGKPQLEFMEMIQPPAASVHSAVVSCSILDFFA